MIAITVHMFIGLPYRLVNVIIPNEVQVPTWGNVSDRASIYNHGTVSTVALSATVTLSHFPNPAYEAVTVMSSQLHLGAAYLSINTGHYVVKVVTPLAAQRPP